MKLKYCFYELYQVSIPSWFWLILPVVAITIFIVIFFFMFKFRGNFLKRKQKETVTKEEAMVSKGEIEELKNLQEEIVIIKEDIKSLKNQLKDLVEVLEKTLASFPSLAQALKKYPLAPIKDLSEAAKYLNLDEIIIFLDNGLPVESYPLPVDEKVTGPLLEIFRLVNELEGSVKSISISSSMSTITIFSLSINEKKFYIAYKVKHGIEESIATIQQSLLRDYVIHRLKELSLLE